MISRQRRTRLFLDAGVIMEGVKTSWGASKAVLIMATFRRSFVVVLAEAVQRELRRNLSPQEGVEYAGWLRRVRVEHWPLPSPDVVASHEPTSLPAIRHANDLVAVVTAVQAAPDWVISSNEAHWGKDVADRTGLRVVTPQDFISRFPLPS